MNRSRINIILTRRRLKAGFASLLVLFVVSTVKGEGPSRERMVKAAFIYNFIQFIQWPDKSFSTPEEPIVLAVLGNDPFEGALEQVIEGKSANNRQITVRHYATLDDVKRCHVLFVPADEKTSLSGIYQRLDGAPVLTIGEADSFTSVGGCIRFFIEDKKIRFEISPEATDKSQLKVSSKLMRLAKVFTRQ